MTDPGTGQPAAKPQRILTIDALRGFAVMGILAMNIIVFAMPMNATLSPMVYGGTDPANIAAWWASFLFIDGKMRGLFELLFGASLLIVTDGATHKGQDAARIHYRRMIVLALIGLAHHFLIWQGDILFPYAVAGSIVFLARHRSPDWLWSRGLFLLVLGWLYWTASMGALLFLDDVQRTAVLADIDLSRNAAAELARFRSDYATIFTGRDGWAPLTQIPPTLLETVPMMLIGMALYRDGFLTGAKPATLYRQWFVRLTGIGLALTAMIAAVMQWRAFDLLTVLQAAFGWVGPGHLLMTIGYAAGLILFIRRWNDSALIARVAAAGRMALSNYLATSLLMTALFEGWGLGYYGYVPRIGLYPIVIAMAGLMLLWSKPWLAHFHYGPMEWMWRTWARGAMQPMRR